MTNQELQRSTNSQDSSYRSIALVELILYIDERRQTEAAVPVFRLADLVSVYMERLAELSPETTDKVNSIHLKECLLLHCPYLKAVKQGRDVLLTYGNVLGDAILKACSDDDSEAIQLAKVALIIRKELFSHGHTFGESLCNYPVESTVPKNLLALVNMIFGGPSIKLQTCKAVSSTQTAQTISELIMLTVSRAPVIQEKVMSGIINSEREVPVLVYLDLKVPSKT